MTEAISKAGPELKRWEGDNPPTQDTEPQPDPAEELDIIKGERAVTLSDGREIPVREYRAFLEGLKVDAIAAGLEADLAAALSGKRQADADTLLVLAGAFGKHPETLAELLAMATDLDAEAIKALPDADGQTLLITWWGLNANFFMRRIVLAMAAQKQAAAIQASRQAEAAKIADYQEQAKSLSDSLARDSASTK